MKCKNELSQRGEEQEESKRDLDTLPSKSLFIIFFVKYINTYIYQGQFKLIKTNSEDIYNITKNVYLKNAFLLNFRSPRIMNKRIVSMSNCF